MVLPRLRNSTGMSLGTGTIVGSMLRMLLAPVESSVSIQVPGQFPDEDVSPLCIVANEEMWSLQLWLCQ